jgi:N6-L-threonylcarbamoyladenine synthase/tRNA threonylcarbamoyladenosine biosynthesis protein TsaB
VTNKIILSLDSSTVRASIAIARGRDILCEVFIVRQKSHSEQMHNAIEEVLIKTNLQLSDVDAVAVTQGPGSFTGLRVAGNIAKTFSYILGVPLLSINTLEALALQFSSATVGRVKVCSMINAFKRMVFLAIYEKNEKGDLLECVSPSLHSLEQLEKIITEQVECVGDAFEYYKDEFSLTLVERLNRSKSSDDYPLPQGIVNLAIDKLNTNQTIVWNQFTPLYLKASEAEENLRKGLLHFRKLT